MNEWEWQLLEDKAPVTSLNVAGVDLKPGDRVRLRPRAGGDIFDLALAGQVATIESIEQDYEGQFQLAVVVDSDPGRDLGLKRQPGHRFFFSPQEVEPAGEQAPVAPPASILIAGIGNIFLGDDAFGVLVGNLDQHDVSRVTFDQRRHIAVLGPADEIAFPMTGNSSIFDGGWPLADRDCILDLSEPALLHAGVSRATDRSPGSEMLEQLLQHSAGLDEQAPVDRLV